jgi:hypothetical protein
VGNALAENEQSAIDTAMSNTTKCVGKYLPLLDDGIISRDDLTNMLWTTCSRSLLDYFNEYKEGTYTEVPEEIKDQFKDRITITIQYYRTKKKAG